MNSPKEIRNALEILILSLSKFNYLILRNWEELPNSLSNDVDLLIKPEEKNQFLRMLSRSFEKEEWLMYNRCYFVCESIFFFHREKHYFFHIDIFTELSYNGISYIDPKKMLENKVIYREVFIPSSADFIIEIISMNTLFKRSLKSKYKHLIQESLTDHKVLNEIEDRLNNTPIFNKQSVAENKKNSFILPLKTTLLNKVLSFLVCNKKTFFTYILSMIKKVIHPKGLYICFMGVDGSGKTTLINNLKVDLEGAFSDKTAAYYHFCPTEHYNKPNENSIVSDPHSKKEYSFIINIAKLFFLLFQFNYGYLKSIYMKKVKNKMIIVDRYFDDLKIDPLRYRMRNIPSLYHFFSQFIPKPNLYIVCIGNDELIYQRKKEVKLSLLKKYQKSLHREFSNKNNAIFINTTENSIDDASFLIRQFIFNYMSKRINE